jgi:hypothetical protein
MTLSSHARDIRDRINDAPTIPALLEVHDTADVESLSTEERSELSLLFGQRWQQLREAGDQSRPVSRHDPIRHRPYF